MQCWHFIEGGGEDAAAGSAHKLRQEDHTIPILIYIRDLQYRSEISPPTSNGGKAKEIPSCPCYRPCTIVIHVCICACSSDASSSSRKPVCPPCTASRQMAQLLTWYSAAAGRAYPTPSTSMTMILLFLLSKSLTQLLSCSILQGGGLEWRWRIAATRKAKIIIHGPRIIITITDYMNKNYLTIHNEWQIFQQKLRMFPLISNLFKMICNMPFHRLFLGLSSMTCAETGMEIYCNEQSTYISRREPKVK